MSIQEKIDIDIFKVVIRAIAESDDLEIMANRMIQLLVGALDIKGCTIFVLNSQTKELEALASCGLSINYINKGPVFMDKSLSDTLKGEPVIVSDITKTKALQYPEDAKEEGIGSIISIPINFYGESIGALRLYHREAWDISDRDVDSLLLFAENIGLAMRYTQLLNSLQAIKDTIKESPLDS